MKSLLRRKKNQDAAAADNDDDNNSDSDDEDEDITMYFLKPNPLLDFSVLGANSLVFLKPIELGFLYRQLQES